MFSTDFISATKEYCTYTKHIPAPYLRKKFFVNSKIDTAKIIICGLGFYKLFINGCDVTKGLLAPYISNPDDYLYYDEYDLTDYLTEGENVLGIMLGNGMQNCFGGSVWDFDLAPFRSAPKVALALKISCGNGEEQVITADESFKTHPSPVLFDDLRSGEIYDANKEIAGWNMPGFDDSAWHNAISAETPRGEARLCTAEPIVVLKELEPVSIREDCGICFKDGLHPYIERNTGGQLPIENEYKKGYLYDFGENLAGNVVLKIKGEKGQRVSVYFGEELMENGDLDQRGMDFQPHAYDHRIIYTLKGDDVEEYTPSFTYQGFRYCLVSGITREQATKDLLTYKVMSSGLKKNGDFTCSEEIVNKLQRATYNADVSNFFYFPTDCPHREKNGWTADAALSAEQMLFNLTPENSYHIWMDNIRKAQMKNGKLPGIVPTSGWGYDWCSGPAWDSVLFYIPYYTWIQRGDTDIIKENAAAFMLYLHYISGCRDDKGLLAFGLGDWVPINYKTETTPLAVTTTLITMNMCTMASKMFSAVNMVKEKAFADSLYDELRDYARKEFLSEDGITVLGRTQTAQSMAIEYGLFDDNEKQKAFDVLLQIIREAEEHLDTGCLGGRVVFHVLAKFGYVDLAYKMITRPDYPSYGFWIVEQNATALFESFRKKWEKPDSRNHHFWGDISSWFFKYISGVKINPSDFDVKEIEISPNFINGLDFADGYQYHLGGKVSSRWEKSDDGYLLTIEIPDQCYGAIKMPDGYLVEGEGGAFHKEISIDNNKAVYIVKKR